MNVTVPLIGLGWQKQAGKDTAAQALVDRGWVRLAFADAIKQMACTIDPIVGINHRDEPLRLVNAVDEMGWELAKDLYEVRRFLQELGVSARKTIDPMVWVDVVMRQAYTLLFDKHKKVVITDVRFPNEVEQIREAGGKLIHIDRPMIQHLDPAQLHPSETSLRPEDFDHTIVNTGSVESLHGRLLVYVNGMGSDG